MTIKIDYYTDPFTHHVYQQIAPKVRATFTPSQVHAIETAIRANKPYQKHAIDIRGVIPLFFMRYYFVFLMGRDKRQPVRDKETIRRKQTAMGSALFSVYIFLCMLLPVIFLALYLLKSFLGIDVFSTLHLSDFLPHG